MNKCCECQKWVWPWQESALAGNVIHAKCHQQILDEASHDHKMRKLIQAELKSIGVSQ